MDEFLVSETVMMSRDEAELQVETSTRAPERHRYLQVGCNR